LDKEVIPFFVDDDADWDLEHTEEYALRKAKPSERKAVAALVTQNLDALDEFKAWLESVGTRKTFFNEEQLRGRVYEALSEWRKRHDVATTGPIPMHRFAQATSTGCAAPARRWNCSASISRTARTYA
jgi:hypothetical protein